MNSEHKDKYKHKVETVDELRDKRRQDDIAIRKCNRMTVMNSKRLKLEPDSQNAVEENDISIDQIIVASNSLVSRDTAEIERNLHLLRKSFAQGSSFIDAFLGVDNSLFTLVGILTCNEPALQLDAAWCLTNIAAGIHEHSKAVLLHASTYLITYLECSNPILQDQCAWALGNIAGDCDECLDELIIRGVVPVLISLLDSAYSNVIRSTCFALCNMIRGDHPKTQLLVDLGIINKVLRLFEYDIKAVETSIEVAWIFTYLSASGENEEELVEKGFLSKLSSLLCDLSHQDASNYLILTPLLRSLGNICSGPDEISQQLCLNLGVIPALNIFLNSEHRHIRKECLWALSNMTSDSDVCHSIVFFHQNMLLSIIKFLSQTHDMKLEAAFCICNIASHGSNHCKALIDRNIMTSMIGLMNVRDIELSRLSLQFFNILFQYVNNDQLVKMFEEAGGSNALEIFEYHESDELRNMTQYILDTFIYHEDDE